MIDGKTTNKKNGDAFIASEVRTKIRSMILASEFKPGQRLVEDELSVVLGVGRTPVREALLLLQGEGFISRDRGWLVHDVDRSQIHSIFESRAAIEGATARLAARHITDETCERLAGMVQKMAPRPELARSVLNRVNTEFHGLIVESAENPFLAEFHARAQFQYWMLRIPIMFSNDQLVAMNEEHRVIVDALSRRHETDAEAAARGHVESTMRIVEPALMS